MELTPHLQHDLVAVQSETELHLMLELTAPTPDATTARPPIWLAVALDRSGSMQGAPLAAARAAASFLVDNLKDDDRLALVTYDSTVELLAPMGPLDRAALHHRIATITPRGMTNLSGGLLKAAEEAGRDPGTDATRRTLLLTDGQANQGITDADQLVGLTETFAQLGNTTSTVGFGDQFDEELLTRLADAGRGGSHWAADPEDLPDIFAKEFEDLLTLVAQNISVELRPSDAVEVIEVLNTYPALPVPGGVQVQVGDAFAGQSIRVVAKLRIPALPGLGLAHIGEVVLRWVGIDGDTVKQHTSTQKLVVNAVSADEAASATADPAVIDEVAILLAGRSAAESRRLADGGDFDTASRIARDAASELRRLAVDHPAADQLATQAAELNLAAEQMDSRSYGARESKRLHYRSREITRRKRGDLED